jgi:SAM-dependent methyltransferase
MLVLIHAAPAKYAVVDVERNFYGVVSTGVMPAVELPPDLDPQQGKHSLPIPRPEHLGLWHGRIRHGSQFVDPARRRQPTSYYGPNSGVGLTLLARRELDRRLHVACVGLGVGTLAAYGRAGDVYRFYEINPAVVRMARQYFSYLRDSEARCEVVLGDARLSLERELPAGLQPGLPADLPADEKIPDELKFDVIALDAFSGDAIPTHLLTIEALRLYLRRLRPDGVLAIHVSNEYLDLSPVVSAAAKELGLTGRIGVQLESPSELLEMAYWILLTRSTESPLWPEAGDAFLTELGGPANVRAWTDSYSNLLQILR